MDSGEFMLLKGVFDYHAISGVFAGLTIILCAVYMLRMYQFSMLGESQTSFKEIGIKQLWPLIILVVIILVIGISPMLILDKVNPAVQKIMLEISNSKGVLS